MTGAAVLFGMGAAKAGTSWLYRSLHDHPDCALPAVKEAHYWDTFDVASRDRQVTIYRSRIAEFQAARAGAEAAGRDWQVRNMNRRIADMTGLIAVLTGDRAGDATYRDWLTGRGEGARLVADITPAYGLLPVAMLKRMVAISPRSLFVYLVRDPLSRLWSHVRMEAGRNPQPGLDLARQANGILTRILDNGRQAHILERGDYPAAVDRLRAAVPEGRLRIAYTEDLVTPAGQRAMADFLGISYHPADGAQKAHEGPRAEMRADLAARAAGFLKDNYDWAARNLGPLPQTWQDNLALASSNGA